MTPGGARLALLRTPATDLVAWFRELRAPVFTELSGELAARLLQQDRLASAVLAHAGVNLYGRWRAKAFTPSTASTGHGYNVFECGSRRRHKLRMHTRLTASALDGQPCFQLDYGPFNRGLVATMIDEVREVCPGVYLGLGRLGFTARQRDHVFPFLLEGPVAPFQLEPRAARRR